MFQTSPLSPLTAAHTALQHLVGLPPPGVVGRNSSVPLCGEKNRDIERVGFQFQSIKTKQGTVNGWISRLEASEVKCTGYISSLSLASRVPFVINMFRIPKSHPFKPFLVPWKKTNGKGKGPARVVPSKCWLVPLKQNKEKNARVLSQTSFGPLAKI